MIKRTKKSLAAVKNIYLDNYIYYVLKLWIDSFEGRELAPKNPIIILSVEFVKKKNKTQYCESKDK